MQVIRNIPAVPAVLAKKPGARNTFIICDSISEFANTTQGFTNGEGYGDWLGGMTGKQSTVCLRQGDMSTVAESDTFMSKLEDKMQFETAKWRNVLDVCGGVPVVPAFLAGQPLNMRRRERRVSEVGPLAIFADLTSSADINSKHMRSRGCAIFALVRLLAAVRPVELWGLIGLGNSNSATEIMTRIDTAPLDMARAAHFLGHPSVTRGLGYGYLQGKYQSGGAWNFGDVDLQRKTARESLLRAVPTTSEVLYLPPVFSSDKAITKPEIWLADMLAQYGGIDQAA